MKLEQKKKIVEELQEEFSNARAVVFVDFSGLGAEALSTLRDKIRSSGGSLRVAKNTLIKRALGKEVDLEGPTAVITSKSDPLAPIKAVVAFGKEMGTPEIKGGFFEKSWTSAQKLISFSRIPSRNALITKAIRITGSPLQAFTLVCSNPIRRLTSSLRALSSQKNQ